MSLFHRNIAEETKSSSKSGDMKDSFWNYHIIFLDIWNHFSEMNEQVGGWGLFVLLQ